MSAMAFPEHAEPGLRARQTAGPYRCRPDTGTRRLNQDGNSMRPHSETIFSSQRLSPVLAASVDSPHRRQSPGPHLATLAQPGRISLEEEEEEDRQIPLRAAPLQPGSRPNGSGHV